MKFLLLLLVVSISVYLYPMKRGHAENKKMSNNRHVQQNTITNSDATKEEVEKERIEESSCTETIQIQDVIMYDSALSQELVKAVEARNESDVRKLLQAGVDPHARDSNEIPCLCIAATKGYEEIVKALLENKADPDQTYKDSLGLKGITPLIAAARQGHREVARLLLAYKVHVNAQTNLGSTALLYAVDKEWKDIVEMLIDHGANVNAQDDRGFSPLMGAVGKGNKEIVEILIVKGASVNVRDGYNRTALGMAIEGRDKEIVKILLDKGADTTITGRWTPYGVDCVTPLMYAVDEECKDIVEMLIAHGAGVNAHFSNGFTALMGAVGKGNKEIVEILIAARADVKAQDSNGRTALIRAIQRGDKEVVKMLLDKGANKEELLTMRGRGAAITDDTPLMLATLKGHKEIAEILIIYGADVNAQDSRGYTALMWAIDKGHKEIVKLLLDKGANITTPYNIYINHMRIVEMRGSIYLMLAVERGYTQIVEMLIAYGADINAQNSSGYTALTQAIIRGHKEVTALLLKHKAKVTEQIKALIASVSAIDECKFIVNLYLRRETQSYIAHPQEYARQHRECYLEERKYSRDCKHSPYLYLLNGDVDHNNRTHQTVLIWASICGHTEAVKELLKADLPLWYLNAQDKYGRTALMYALIYGHIDVAQLLIQAYERKSKQAYEALEKEANTAKKEQLEQELKKVKRAINITDAQGNSAFSYALEKRDSTIVLRFLQAGARPSIAEIKTIAEQDKKDLLLELMIRGFINPYGDK